MRHLGVLLQETADRILVCEICRNIDEISPCKICQDDGRDRSLICVVNNIEDLWNVEESGHYRGLYHVIGRKNAEHYNIAQLDAEPLLKHLEATPEISEVILANNSTVAGQTSMFYIVDVLKEFAVEKGRFINITALGRGIPIGSEINYLDEGTLMEAFRSRKTISTE
jgi:recombination protein RecR